MAATGSIESLTAEMSTTTLHDGYHVRVYTEIDTTDEYTAIEVKSRVNYMGRIAAYVPANQLFYCVWTDENDQLVYVFGMYKNADGHLLYHGYGATFLKTERGELHLVGYDIYLDDAFKARAMGSAPHFLDQQVRGPAAMLKRYATYAGKHYCIILFNRPTPSSCGYVEQGEKYPLFICL